AIEPENIDGQTVNLNNLTIIKSDAGAVKYYICPSSAGGAVSQVVPDLPGGDLILENAVRDGQIAQREIESVFTARGTFR
ncbi:hypothetical protein E7V02_19905, partial [Escherichia coli]|nr:hypothetical protein [Escherichia coli]